MARNDVPRDTLMTLWDKRNSAPILADTSLEFMFVRLMVTKARDRAWKEDVSSLQKYMSAYTILWFLPK